MYYEKTPELALRFGDVIRGFILAATNVDKPIFSLPSSAYSIDVEVPQFCAVLSPCCSIGDGTILLSSLIRVKQSFFQNPYFTEDLTRINREMEPSEKLPPSVWAQLDAAERSKRESEGKGYAVLDSFIYPEDAHLPRYPVKIKGGGTVETGYYMIDFRNIQKVTSKTINRKSAPDHTKLLQLTPSARQELRDKIAFFYGRVPEEDKILLGD